MMADCGSYFHNYLQKKQTYMRRKKRERKRKRKEEKRKRKKKKKVELIETGKRKEEED